MIDRLKSRYLLMVYITGKSPRILIKCCRSNFCQITFFLGAFDPIFDNHRMQHLPPFTFPEVEPNTSRQGDQVQDMGTVFATIADVDHEACQTGRFPSFPPFPKKN